MLQDIEADQQTEIETLNGEIVRRGERHGIETPINRTLTNLVRLAETSDS
jgi:Ketopantoate reductase